MEKSTVALVYAYAIWRARGLLRVTLIAGVLVSMFTAIVVKLFAAVLVFSSNGVVNGLLVGTGLVGEPLALVNNAVGAVIGQLYIVVPYSVLAVYSVLSTVDESLLEPVRDLGAGRLRAFREVVAPNLAAGLVAATLIAFVVSLQEFVMTLFLSGRDTRTVPVAAWNSLDPLVSVTSTLLVGSVLLAVVAAGFGLGFDRLARDT